MASKNRAGDSKKGSNVSSQPPQWTDYLLCSYCEKEFNRTDRCPVSLVCSHTFCKTCLVKLSSLGKHCQYDQTPITCNLLDLPINSALLQLLPGDSGKHNLLSHHHVTTNKSYETAKACIEELALFLKPGRNCDLSRPMQRKLVALINCQLVEDEGRKRSLRACRALGERTATELILLHQNPTTLSASLWAAVRARGCQFLGPAMQEEALKLIHLALEDGSELSRKVLVGIVVKNLQTQFAQASKTSIGHVVQLLYRASCFKVTKRDADSSLMRLKDDFLSYEDLRKEHDSQVVQIAREAGLRIAPDQWSALLYGDQVHKSYMQSIIDRLQSGASFKQCITDLHLALERSSDPGNVHSLLPHFSFLSELDTETPSWNALEKSTYSAKVSVKELVKFMKNHSHWLWQCQDATQQTSKYKTSMCRDSKNKGVCPRGQSCTFAHSDEELQHYRNRRKKGGQIPFNPGELSNESENVSSISLSHHNESPRKGDLETNVQANHSIPHNHACQCGNTSNQTFKVQNPAYFQGPPAPVNSPGMNPTVAPNLAHSLPMRQNLNQPLPLAVPQQIVGVQNIPQQPPTQPPYMASNQVVYESKPYETVHVVQNNQPSYPQTMPMANAGVQNSNTEPVHPTILQQNHYMVHRQQPPSYSSIRPNSMSAVVQEQPVPPSQSYALGPSYTCLTLHNGQQVAVAANPRPELVQQAPVVYQQQAVQTQNLPQNAVVKFQSNVMLQPTPQPHHVTPARPPPPIFPHRDSGIPSGELVIAQEEPPVLRSQAHSQYHLAVTTTVENPNLPSLAELRHRKDEVINKLVKKRIVAPSMEDNIQQKMGVYYDMPDKHDLHSSVAGDGIHNSTARSSIALSPSFNSSTIVSAVAYSSSSALSASKDFPNKTSVSHGLTLTSDGRYSLWTGTTCIPSLSGLSFYDYPSENRDQSSPTSIDVLSDLDTRTSQVPAFLGNTYPDNYSSHFSQASASRATLSMALKRSDDDIVSIQDQRIVSKYGPIARTVRSKTTSAIPEQVTANANAATQPFPSDKSRNKTNFFAGESSDNSQNILFICSEVEPTANSVNPRKLPDVISGNNIPTSAMQHEAMYYQKPQDQALQEDINTEENEDLLLAIELQQIEMGIQRIQRDSKTK